MNRVVKFKRLSLLSDRDGTARAQSFSDNRSLFLGTNGTGKSRITKGIFWALGCAPPKWLAGAWDPDVTAALHFEWRGQEYFSLRQNKRLGMFSADGRLLFSAASMSTWDRDVARFFGSQVQLARHQGAGHAYAGPSFLTLPFYMDQDGSWGQSWDTFTDLSQFSKWKAELFDAFVGVRPNAYFEAKRSKDEIHRAYLDKVRELDAQQSAFKRVNELLPANLPALSYGAYRKDLADVGHRTMSLQRSQTDLRARLVSTMSEKERVRTELRLAQTTQAELMGDMELLSDLSDSAVECPTCGTVHTNSFHARLELSRDADAITALVGELQSQLSAIADKEKAIRHDLRQAERDIGEFDRLMARKKAKLELADIAAAHGKKTLDAAFQRVSDDLGVQVKKLRSKEGAQDQILKSFIDPARTKEVRAYYANQVQSLSSLFNVDPAEQMIKPKPGARSLVGGSSSPRSMLAVHIAMIRANSEHGDSPQFPFVIDTVQQSGQANENLQRMIELLPRAMGAASQVILAAEQVPPGTDLSAYEIVHLDKKHAVLNAAEYKGVAAAYAPAIAALWASLETSDV